MAYITVTGFATRIFYDNRGVEVTEFYTTQTGEQAKRTYTAWFEQAVTFPINAEGRFSGLLGHKIEDWTNPDGSAKLNFEGKPGRSVKISINGARFEAIASERPIPSAPAYAEDEMPF